MGWIPHVEWRVLDRSKNARSSNHVKMKKHVVEGKPLHVKNGSQVYFSGRMESLSHREVGS